MLRHLFKSCKKYYTIYEMHGIQKIQEYTDVIQIYILQHLYFTIKTQKIRKPDALVIYRLSEVQVIIKI